VQVDHIIFVSSPGLATPTLDAHLILRQRLRLEEESLREFTDYNEKFPCSSLCGRREK
jgi:hypothetical protein